MNTATKKPGLQALAFSTAIQRILHFFTFSHAQFPPGTLSPLLKSVVWSSRALLDYLCYFIFPFYACIW